MVRYMLLGVAPTKPGTPAPGDRSESSWGGCWPCMYLSALRPSRPLRPLLVREEEELPAAARALIARMTCENAARRIGLSEVAGHAWLVKGGRAEAEAASGAATHAERSVVAREALTTAASVGATAVSAASMGSEEPLSSRRLSRRRHAPFFVSHRGQTAG